MEGIVTGLRRTEKVLS